MILQTLFAFLAWVVILPACFVSGLTAKRWFDTEDEILNGVIACALGFAVLSYGVVVLSYSVGLNTFTLWAFLGIILLLRVKQLPECVYWLRAIPRDLLRVDLTHSSFLVILSWAAISVLFFAALTPEIGGDSLVYHLNLPKVFLSQGSLTPSANDPNSYFPLFMNNLYLAGLAIGGVLTAKLFSFMTGFLMWTGVQRIVFRETEQRNLALGAGLALLLTPVFYNLLSTTYVDPAVAFYTLLSVFLFVEASSKNRLAFFGMSGFLIGCAFAIKYLAVVSILTFGALWIWQLLETRNPRASFKGFSLWFTGLLLGGGYWLVRNWFLLKNPIFPYLGSVFGTPELSAAHFEIYGIGKSMFHFFVLFWHLFRYPAEFGAFSDRIGLFYLLALPFVILAVIRVPRTRPYFIFGAAFLLLWFFVCQANRYLLPILPMMLILAAVGIKAAGDRIQHSALIKKIAVLLINGCLMFYLAAGIFHYRYAALLHLGIWRPAEYLKNLERTIPIATWINRNLAPDARILLASEPRQFYFNRFLIRDVFLQYRTSYGEKKWEMKELHDFFKSEGITHLLLSRPKPDQDGVSAAPLLEEFAASAFAKPIHNETSSNIRDAQYQYDLFELS